MITNHKRTAEPIEEPITLTEVKSNLGIADTTRDTEIADIYIPAARRKIENYLGQALIDQTWQVIFDEWPDKIELARAPVTSVTSVQYYDADGNLQTLSADQYLLINHGIAHYIYPAPDVDWPDLQDRPNAVLVTYQAGKANAAAVDEQIKICMHLIVGFYVNQPRQAEAGLNETRQVNWIMRDTIGDLREVKI